MVTEQMQQFVFSDVARQLDCFEEDISVVKQFKEGMSGDQVMLINVSRAQDMKKVGEYILKICSNGENNEFEHEIKSTYAVSQKCNSQGIRIPEFRLFSTQYCYYYVCDVAGEGMKETSDLSSQQTDKKKSRLGEFISRSLSASQDSCSSDNATVQQMIMEWLGEKRLASDSRLTERIRKMIHDELSPGWRVNGEIFPNPYYFMNAPDSIVIRNVLKGPQHGDLNQNNIIIQPLEREYQYYIIDFSHYKDRTYLLFDQAYLLLDVLLDIDGMLLSDWIDCLRSFFTALSGGERKIDADGEFFKYVNAFIGGWRQFYVNYPNNGKTLVLQLLCAFVAAGLNFMNKYTILESRQIFSFVCASLALSELIKHDVGFRWDEKTEYPVLNFGTGKRISELWNITGSFSPSTRFVLLTSCLESDMECPDNFLSLGFVPWEAIIEVNGLPVNDLRNKALERFRQKKGYRYVLLDPDRESRSSGREAVWISIVQDEGIRNKNIFFRKYIQLGLQQCLKDAFSLYEKYPICIIVDSQHLDMSFCDNILTELLVAAEDNTCIDVIFLSECENSVEEDDYIKRHIIECSLDEIAISIRMSFEKKDEHVVGIPMQGGGVQPLNRNVVTEVENDMRIICRSALGLENDDQGDGFYRGNEATWSDIASHRDVDRVDYRDRWHDRISERLKSIGSSSSELIWLYHKPGGGGTTMAKRIMWDFCTQFPTVYLQKISEKTSERLKMLYNASVKALLIVCEISDSEVSGTSITTLRRELIKMNIRALFICVQRTNERINDNASDFYLPDTPKMCMSNEEAEGMYKSFSSRLNKDLDQRHIEDLGKLTYMDIYSDELRQPFFYGLFAFGENYQKLEEYVRVNLKDVSEQGKILLEILAFITIYSQTLNLNIREVAYILFPEHVVDQEIFEKTRQFLSENCFVVSKDTGYRISHPLIARRLLESMFQEDYYSGLVKLAKKIADRMGSLYSGQSFRLNTILQELFIHREPITENQRTVFSTFITELPSDGQRIEVMKYLEEKFPSNPHYSNHLARLYLRPLDENQWPDIPNAKQYAREAIDRSESTEGESSSIHHHLMGKVYSMECVSQLRKDIYRNHITHSVQKALPFYQKAVMEFNISSKGNNSAYGLIGKLELINKFLGTIRSRGMNIQTLMSKEESIRGTLTDMIAEAGEIINKCILNQEEQDLAFRMAMLRFYEIMGRTKEITLNFKLNEPNLKVRANLRRTIVTILESNARDPELGFSYDKLSENELLQITALMEDNVYKDSIGNDTDRFRWLEAYRRLEDFDLRNAYRFLQEWPDTPEALDVSYYRYITAFLLYLKNQDVPYQTVKEHLAECGSLAQKAYGRNTSATKDLLGRITDHGDKDLLIPWRLKGQSINLEDRDKGCMKMKGSVSSVRDGVVEFRFTVENTGRSLFYAKTPKIDELSNVLEGQQACFHLGFSYSGFRAWDVILDEPTDALH